ncbi:PREDICTED: Retrovirus-related Pol poly from transposon TNT [Prunus dulcis]|uniref:PREDICTED: Retrovirus-related Pol poly from transposon TNT n=1 Tax=Prunus dulcis TaxID=3755 RepID=A0A5E4FRR7_PRUDU|nr:PREDICTED: Retrovirus-related Pol poly from transposon TNT [Prunus dulcis]
MADDNKTPQTVASVKVELKHFTGKENFTLWQMRMKYILNEHVLSVVLSEEITNQTWEKLGEMFASKSLSNKHFLKDEVLTLRVKDDRNMMKHLSTFNMCIANFQWIYEVYKLEDKVVLLLTSLPSSYKHFRMTLIFGQGTLKFEEVVQDVLKYHRMVQCSKGGSQSEGLVARIGGWDHSSKHEGKTRHGRNSRFEYNEDCFKCRSKEHWKWNCPIWKEKRNKMKDTEGGGENSTKEDCKMESGVVCTKEKRAKDLIINEPVQRNEVTSSLKTRDVSQG